MGEDWNVGHAVNNSGKLDISYACTLWQLEWIVMITMVFSEECKWGMHSNIQEEKLDRYITQKCNAIGCCWSWRIRKWSPALSSEVEFISWNFVTPSNRAALPEIGMPHTSSSTTIDLHGNDISSATAAIEMNFPFPQKIYYIVLHRQFEISMIK